MMPEPRMKISRFPSLFLLPCLLWVGSPAVAAPQADSDRAVQKAKERDEARRQKELARRLEKLDEADRAALDAAVGSETPAFPESIAWIGTPAKLGDLRGRVVVIQTFTTRGSARGLPDRVAKSLGPLGDEVVLVAVHTPEGEDKAEMILAKDGPPCPVALDRTGEWCDAVGAFKKPVNLVVAKNGDLRAAGLTNEGLVATVKELLEEEWDPSMVPTRRRVEATPPPKSASYPKPNEPVQGATDLRGKPCPPTGNVRWEWGAPSPQGKLVVVDFWGTWCPPCIAAIPHLNDIARSYPQDIAVLGISAESNSNFAEGLRKRDLKRTSFAYAVGNDPSGGMEKAFGVRAWPHVAIVSADGVVRWQGHPNALTPSLLREFVDAHRAGGAGTGGATGGGRWKSSAGR